MPVKWEELKAGSSEYLHFDPVGALRRLGKIGDLLAPMLELQQKLPV
jgi:hypothetical protein